LSTATDPSPKNSHARPTSRSFLLVVPIFALGMGMFIHHEVVKGDYEWLGLLRILRDVSHRPGFWVICMMVWLVGLSHAPLQYSILSQKRQVVLSWIAVSAMILLLVRCVPRLISAGSLVDECACAVAAPGLVIHLFIAPGTPRAKVTCACWTLGTAALVYASFTAVAFGHTMLKGMLFSIAKPVDAMVFKVDCGILGSHFYDKLAAWRIAVPQQLIRALDIIYVELYEQQWWSFFYFFGARDFRNGRIYILATLAIYFVGPMCYFMAPSLGPMFHRPDLFNDLSRLAPDTTSLARFLADQTQLTITGQSHPIAPFGFIAAFPSLHVALALVVLLVMRHSRVLTIFNLLGALFTFVATVVLGWHYMIDGLFGAALGLLCWSFASRIVAREATVLDGS
jgi:hypothetical protein